MSLIARQKFRARRLPANVNGIEASIEHEILASQESIGSQELRTRIGEETPQT